MSMNQIGGNHFSAIAASSNKRVEADAVKRHIVSCCCGGRAAHAQR